MDVPFRVKEIQKEKRATTSTDRCRIWEGSTGDPLAQGSVPAATLIYSLAWSWAVGQH